MSAPQTPIVSVIVRRYRPDQATDFLALSERIQAEVALRPGFSGLKTKLSERADHCEHVTIFAFDTRAQLQDWEGSPRRHDLMRALDKVSLEGVSHTRFGDLAVLSDPNSDLGKGEIVIILIFWIFLLGAALQWLADLILPAAIGGSWRSLLLISVNVVLISYLFLPWSSRLWGQAKGWLAGRAADR